MKKIKLITYILMVCVFAAAVLAFAAEVKKDLPPLSTAPASKQVIQPASQIPDAAYNYNPLGKPDPFRPFVEIEMVAKKKQEERKKTTSMFPLQRIEADKFRLVGIAGDNVRRVAIVEDTVRKFYPLFVGTHIGVNDGKVVDILTDRIIIEEFIERKAARIIMKLRKN